MKSKRDNICALYISMFVCLGAITARHTEYDEGYVFSLSFHRRGDLSHNALQQHPPPQKEGPNLEGPPPPPKEGSNLEGPPPAPYPPPASISYFSCIVFTHKQRGGREWGAWLLRAGGTPLAVTQEDCLV